jgi:hypothetical protein
MKRLLVILAVLVPALCAHAQQRGKNSLAGVPANERIFFGGGGSFGGGVSGVNSLRYTYISVSPLMGWRVNVPFSVGAGIQYTWFNYPDVDVSLSQFGFSPFAQYRVGKLFGYAEYSIISVPSFDNTSRANYTRLPVGIGFSQPIGTKAAINAMALYDVIYARHNPPVFASPWVIRVFFTAGGISM